VELRATIPPNGDIDDCRTSFERRITAVAREISEQGIKTEDDDRERSKEARPANDESAGYSGSQGPSPDSLGTGEKQPRGHDSIQDQKKISLREIFPKADLNCFEFK
jgi:hypothetical protein